MQRVTEAAKGVNGISDAKVTERLGTAIANGTDRLNEAVRQTLLSQGRDRQRYD